jgi:DNA-binding MarR family transcriptional regulator
MARKTSAGRAAPHQLDPIIHERLRLGILSALVVQESLTFTELRGLLRTTDGNLSAQARRLEEAGYVVCTKRFVGRKPKSTYRLSASGRRALEEYLETLSNLLPDVGLVRSARQADSLRRDIQPLPSPG